MSVDLSKYQPTIPGPRCSVGHFLDSATQEQTDDFWTLVNHPIVTYAKIEEHAPDDLGVRLKAHTISRHVRGLCSCDG